MERTEQKHLGFANYETWNVVMWLETDEKMQQYFQNFMRFRLNTFDGKPFDTSEIIWYCENIAFTNGFTPDGCFLLFVNWQEVTNRVNDYMGFL